MQAKIYVQANDAIDLGKDQKVQLRLDAFPDKSFAGKISVAGFPRSIERGNPVTYFEVTAQIEQQDKSIMQPGRKITAKIDVKAPSSALVVPLQTLHHQNGKTYVYLKNGSEFTRQEVVSGRKNLHLVEQRHKRQYDCVEST